MARVLIVERAGREAEAAAALVEAGFAVRTIEADPLLPGNVVDALENVAVVAWLMGSGDNLHPEINGEQLETALLKVVDTGVRGFVFERPSDAANEHVEHARSTWHIPIEEIPLGIGDEWTASLVAAVNKSLGI
jgi:hypothetical protein